MERTHNQSSPNSDAGITYPPRPLSTRPMVPYQSEEKVKVCVSVRHCVEDLRIPYPYVPA